MSDTPRTKDAFDALRARACGTEYVKAKMEELERELAAVTAERDSLAHYAGCQPAHSDYQTADQMRADLDSAVAELSAMTADLDAERAARLALQFTLEGIATASPGQWEISPSEFADSFRPWAQNIARHALAAKLP